MNKYKGLRKGEVSVRDGWIEEGRGGLREE